MNSDVTLLPAAKRARAMRASSASNAVAERRDIAERLARRHADLLIEGGTVLTPNGAERIDIACVQGRVVALGDLASSWHADDRLAAGGLHVLPGVIDTQVHFRDPGLTHKETLEAGTRGAVLGGVTAVFEMPNTQPLTLEASDLRDKLELARGRAWCDHAFYLGGSAINAERLAVLETLPGCAGVKVFMGSSFGNLLADDDAVLRRIVRNGRRRMAVHAEDEARLRARRALVEASGDVRDHPHWRDPESALMATRRVVAMAAETGRKLHVLHVSTAEEMAFLAQHKRRVSVEVTPHHLTLEAPGCYERLGTLAQMNPPVRDASHREALWQAIRDGVVDVIGSDHAPHTLEEKARPYPGSPSGMTGVQTLLPVMLDHVAHGRLSLQRLVDLTGAGPARLFGIEGKGRIALGYDADFSIVDLGARRTIRDDWIASVSGWTPYDGMACQGWPVATVLRGQPVMRDEVLVGTPAGQPLKFLDQHAG
ncbi:dihydroorotase [Burkholderia sp. 3C]